MLLQQKLGLRLFGPKWGPSPEKIWKPFCGGRKLSGRRTAKVCLGYWQFAGRFQEQSKDFLSFMQGSPSGPWRFLRQ